MKLKRVATYVAAGIGILLNIAAFWQFTEKGILECIFGGFIMFWLICGALAAYSALLEHYCEWKAAEQHRAEQIARKRRRRKQWQDIRLSDDQEDIWYEVPVEKIV